MTDIERAKEQLRTSFEALSPSRIISDRPLESAAAAFAVGALLGTSRRSRRTTASLADAALAFCVKLASSVLIAPEETEGPEQKTDPPR